ncbi:hypothetical protein NKH77_53710 [Streptomyces sp. M19]
MVGDGVEISYLTDYLQQPDGGGLADEQATFATVTAYGIAVMIASWFSGTLSSIWGPRRVMWLGAAWWVGFELVFLFLAIPSQNLAIIATVYGIRGFAYPSSRSPSWSGPRPPAPADARFGRGLVLVRLHRRAAHARRRCRGPLHRAARDEPPRHSGAVLFLVAIGGAIGSFAVRDPRGCVRSPTPPWPNRAATAGCWRASTSSGATSGRSRADWYGSSTPRRSTGSSPCSRSPWEATTATTVS